MLPRHALSTISMFLAYIPVKAKFRAALVKWQGRKLQLESASLPSPRRGWFGYAEHD